MSSVDEVARERARTAALLDQIVDEDVAQIKDDEEAFWHHRRQCEEIRRVLGRVSNAEGMALKSEVALNGAHSAALNGVGTR